MDRFRRSRGFTLIELMIVIFVMLILISIAVPNFTRSVQRSREAVLRQNLVTLRDLIFVMRKDQINTAAMDIKTLTELTHRHRRAF